MSTKTTFKRLALVTVAALGMGTLSAVVPTAANAAYNYQTAETPFVVTVADTVVGGDSYNSTTGVWDSGTAGAAVAVTQVAGAGNFVEIEAAVNDTTTATNVTVTVTGTTIAVAKQPTGTGANQDTFTVNALGTVATAENYKIAGAKLRILVPAVGTYTATVAKVVVLGGISTTTTQQVFTITGVAAATRGVVSVANSTSIFDSGTAAAAYSADETILAAGVSTAANITAGRITVTLKDGQATPAAVADKVVSVSISGPGLIIATATAPAAAANGYGKTTTMSGGARVATATSNASGQIYIGVASDGTPGVGTITISQGTTVIATETVTFYGEATKLEATAVKTVLSTTNSATLEAIEVKATDSAGRLVTGMTASAFTATSSNAAVVASAITAVEGLASELAAGTNKGPGYYYVTVSSAAAGTIASGSSADVTVKYTYSATQIVTANAVKISTGGAVIYGATLTADKTTAQPGELVTLTLKATDKAGNPVADGTYVVFDTTTATSPSNTAFVSSAVLTTNPFSTGAVTFTGGSKTATFYAPTTGSVVLTGTFKGDVSAALDATTLKTTITITSDALEAANAATTAALAANDAVDALAATVAKLVANLKAQITALTKLIVKIQKKVGA